MGYATASDASSAASSFSATSFSSALVSDLNSSSAFTAASVTVTSASSTSITVVETATPEEGDGVADDNWWDVLQTPTNPARADAAAVLVPYPMLPGVLLRKGLQATAADRARAERQYI